MLLRPKHFFYGFLALPASLIIIFGLLRLQIPQYLAAYTGSGFAKPLPKIEAAKVSGEHAAGSCQSQAIRVLTYNVRYGSDLIEDFRKSLGSGAPGDYLPWSARYPEMKKRVENYAPDLIGLQEMQTDQDISRIVSLQQYTLQSYHLNSFEYGDAALLFRTNRFEKLDSGQLWLGPDANLPLSLGFKPLAVIRYVNWAMLREKTTGFTFIFINTHFDNNSLNREKSADLFNQNFTKLSMEYPLIITGDFNSKAVTERYQRLIGSSDSAMHLTNAYDLDLSPKSSEETNPNDLIDHILVGGPCAAMVSNWQVDKRTLESGDTLSDHDPVMAQLYFIGRK